jgi:hypothetical protein
MRQGSEPSSDPTTIVQTWQRSSAAQKYPAELGIAGRLFQASVEQYSILLKAARNNSGFSSSIIKKMRSALGLFILWGDGFRVLDGELDANIQISPRLCTAVLSLLVSIAETVSQSQF